MQIPKAYIGLYIYANHGINNLIEDQCFPACSHCYQVSLISRWYLATGQQDAPAPQKSCPRTLSKKEVQAQIACTGTGCTGMLASALTHVVHNTPVHLTEGG